MPNSITSILSQMQHSGFTALFLDAAMKSFAVLTFACGLCLIWRRASAASRHTIWFVALIASMLLPLLSWMLPSWQKPVWSVTTELESGNQVSITLASTRVTESTAQPLAPTPALSDESRSPDRHVTARFDANWFTITIIVWILGATMVLALEVIGRWNFSRTFRNARCVKDGHWLSLLEEARGVLQLRRSVTLLQAPVNIMPLTWGWWRPTVALPADADQWSIERRRLVLLHELAHVKRWDCLTHFIARIVSTLYWFNPLAWIASRQMCIERERACDDLVLSGGCMASNYATHLVDIARTFRLTEGSTVIAMARRSGLERRVNAILDQSLNRKQTAKAALGFITIAVVVLEFIVRGFAQQSPSQPWTLENSRTSERLKQFVEEKHAQTIASVKAEGREMLPEYDTIFAAAAKLDWNSISNTWEDLRRRAPQYEGNGTKDPRLHGTGWQAMLEIWGGFGNIIAGGGEGIVNIGDGIIDSIPQGSIYFGGTDPGRFVVTVLQKSQVNGEPFFTVTQNALADGTYLQYIRSMYGAKIYTPTEEDSQKSFADYVSDAGRRFEEHKLKPGEDVKMVDGKVQVGGQVAVMNINGLLAKIIFDKNPSREFYVEESFPLDWMYPYLEPSGFIMKINRQPVAEMTDKTVERDRAFWSKRTIPVLGGSWLEMDMPLKTVVSYVDKTYGGQDPNKYVQTVHISADGANKWLAKLRSSIGGLYAWRLEHATDVAEKARMAREAEFAFRQAWAICPYSPEALYRYVTILVQQGRPSDALLIAQTSARLDPSNQQVNYLVESLKKTAQTR